MSYNIYGQPLRSGYCEVHPDVPQSYPCGLCIIEAEHNEQRRQEEQRYYEAEAEYYECLKQRSFEEDPDLIWE